MIMITIRHYKKIYPWVLIGWLGTFAFCTSSSSNSHSESSSGDGAVTSSLNRFAIIGNNLYAGNTNLLSIFDITNPAQPVSLNQVTTSTMIETVFPYQNNLLLGSSTGLYIYDLINPQLPGFVSSYVHFTACDPVVAANNVAFVTLRSGCGQSLNELHVLDISNINSPVLLQVYPMTLPGGLFLDGNLLFVADDSAGLKIYNILINNVLSLRENIALSAVDVIADNATGTLYIVDKGGIYLYDYTTNPVTFISRLTY